MANGNDKIRIRGATRNALLSRHELEQAKKAVDPFLGAAQKATRRRSIGQPDAACVKDIGSSTWSRVH